MKQETDREVIFLNVSEERSAKEHVNICFASVAFSCIRNVIIHEYLYCRFDLLDHCYTKFDKCHFAGLCKLLAKAAVQGDRLSQWLFKEAGHVLARHIAALLPHVDRVSICH